MKPLLVSQMGTSFNDKSNEYTLGNGPTVISYLFPLLFFITKALLCQKRTKTITFPYSSFQENRYWASFQNHPHRRPRDYRCYSCHDTNIIQDTVITPTPLYSFSINSNFTLCNKAPNFMHEHQQQRHDQVFGTIGDHAQIWLVEEWCFSRKKAKEVVKKRFISW